MKKYRVTLMDGSIKTYNSQEHMLVEGTSGLNFVRSTDAAAVFYPLSNIYSVVSFEEGEDGKEAETSEKPNQDLIDEAYFKGAKDLLNAVRKILDMGLEERQEIFGPDGGTFNSLFNELEAAVILSVLKAHEDSAVSEEQLFEIGDQVQYVDRLTGNKGGYGVVVHKLASDGWYRIMYKDGATSHVHSSWLVSTGRHFDQIGNALDDLLAQDRH